MVYQLIKYVYGVSIPVLVSQSENFSEDSRIWKEIAELQYVLSSPLSIRGSLLAVGGLEDSKAVSAILLYQPDTGVWEKVGELPTPRCRHTCLMITDRKLLVAGGTSCGERVDIAEIDF